MREDDHRLSLNFLVRTQESKVSKQERCAQVSVLKRSSGET